MAAKEGGGDERSGGNRREPSRSLQGLLEMAVVAGEARPERREPMAEERHQWLQSAISEAREQQETHQWLQSAISEALGAAGGSHVELQRCLGILNKLCPGEETAERGVGESSEQQEALEELQELCESLDNANDFCSLGGLEVISGLLSHPWAPIRSSAARVLGCCSQNLPKAQSRALALGALQPLLGMLQGEAEPEVSCAALFAISCLVRSQPEGLQLLEDLGGLEILGGTLQSPLPPLRAKGAFVLHCLLREQPRIRASLLQQGLVPRVVSLLRSEHDGAHEHSLGILCGLTSDFPEGIRECRIAALGLEDLLRERREMLKGKEEFQEELEFCERLLQICFETPPEETTMDR